LQGDFNDGGGADIPSQDLGLGSTTLSTNYGDLLFNLGTSLVASPTVAAVGGSVSLSGNGLAASTLYDLGISIAGSDSSSPAVPSTCSLTGVNPAQPPQVILGSFTSTSSGGIPAGSSVSVTDMATFSGLEQGTLMCIFAETPSNFGTINAAGSSQFLLQASANLNMTSAPAGHNVVISAHALNANRGYSILFAPYTCGINVCGTVVGAMLTNAAGAAISTFTVPSVVQTSSGAQSVVSGNSYAVQLQEQGVPTNQALAAPSFLTVGPSSGGGPSACNTTSCMTAATPTSTHVGTNPAVQTTYTNTSNAPVTAIVYGVVHNSAGQTVYYTTATITVAAGGSATAYDVIAGLPSGTYSVTIFAVSTSGTAISTSSTVTVTI
jgi:hypothetical protein